MECYILTTVNRGTREKRGNQAAHQLQGLLPVTFNSSSDYTICLAWYARTIFQARALTISSASSSSTFSSMSILITTEHFHTLSMPHMNQITAKTLWYFTYCSDKTLEYIYLLKVFCCYHSVSLGLCFICFFVSSEFFFILFYCYIMIESDLPICCAFLI